MDEDKPVIIVVEDDPSVLRAVRRLLVASGFEVRAFARPSALAATDIPASNACLLLDVYLPEMTGVELCKALRAGGCRLPVIITTGRLDEKTSAMIAHINAISILIKPFTRDSLLNAISKALTAGRHTG